MCKKLSREEDFFMNIIIAGCGKVGVTLAEQLRAENHEITMVDIDAERLEHTMSQLDIQVISGNTISPSPIRTKSTC